METDRERVIGIDIGTTNSCVAIVESGVPMIIPSSQGQGVGGQGKSRIPSVIALTDQGKRLVGHLAKRQAIVNAEHTAYALKRLLGRKFGSQAVRQVIDMVSYRVVAGPADEVRIALHGETYPVHEMYAAFLQELRRAAESYLHEPVTKAVLTVPAYFSDGQRQALKEAARLAGLEVIRILAEPIAAAIAYGIGSGEIKSQRVAVYDLGGGTFDFTLLELRGGAFEVRATAGDTFLGGEDFDRRLLDYLTFGFAKDHKIDLRQDRTALQRLRDAVEKAKIDLSSATETTLEVPFIISTGTSEPLHLRRLLTRAKLEELTEDLVERTLQICRSALAEVGVDCHEIETVILVGGMTRTPRVLQAVTELFGRAPVGGLNNEDVIAIGAALQGAALLTATPSTPAYQTCPRALGLLVAGGQQFNLVEPGATLPTESRYVFTTTRDDQTGLKLLVVEGKAPLPSEPERPEQSELLGEFIVDGLRPAPRGEVEVEVSFAVAQSGQLTITATDLESGKPRQVAYSLASPPAPRDLKQTPAAGTYALELQRDDEYYRAQQRTERLIGEILLLLPRAEHAVGGSELGQDAMRRARAAVERAKIAIIRGEPVTLLDAQEVLERTATMLRGVTQALRAS